MKSKNRAVAADGSLKAVLSGNGSSAVPAPGSTTAEVTASEKFLLAGAAAEAELAEAAERRKIGREKLVNRLNLAHFLDDAIQVVFRHRRYDRRVMVAACPLPCAGHVLECRWAHPADAAAVLAAFDLAYILVPHGRRFIKCVPEVIALGTDGARLALPEVSHDIGHRRAERQACRGVSASLTQNSSSFSGNLIDFSAYSFRIEAAAAPPQRFEWIDPELPVTVALSKAGRTLYAGDCRVIRSSGGAALRHYVLEPLRQEIRRHRKADIRSRRHVVNPSPNLVFRHPLTGRRVDLKAIDLSGSGFAVAEDDRTAVLVPGLILPEVEIRFATGLALRCSVQVVFRRPEGPRSGPAVSRCGLALIDMPAEDHVKLLAVLHQTHHPDAYVCNELDLESLWDFLFETGFIYPGKYAVIAPHKEEIKKTYETLYARTPQIARHFVHQRNGVILGHLAMVRFWQRTWLIHHHAARTSVMNRAGLAVLNQISFFTHDAFRVRSLHLDYLACYYRPQNRFPQRFFGGFAQSLDDPQACSIDPFAYMQPAGFSAARGDLPDDWRLAAASAADLAEMNDAYREASGGLMLQAFDLEPHSWERDDLDREYAALGLHRRRRFFALSRRGRLKAFVVANVSDVGLNLSDLTHCLQVIVTDPGDLDPEVFMSAARQAAREAGLRDPVLLVYPERYPRDASLPVEKTYHLWTFHVYSAGQAYLKYLSRWTRRL